MSSKPLLRWLHLSDLHIGAGDGHHRYDRRAVMDALLRDAEAMSKAQGGPPDWVFLTGDIAFSAQADQYALPPKGPGEDGAAYQERRKGTAQYELGRLAKALGIGPERILMVPGNHDVDRDSASRSGENRTRIEKAHKLLRAFPKDLDDYLSDPAELATTLWPKLHPYATFAASYGAPESTPASPFWTKTLVAGPRPIVAVGLNTCLLSYDNDDGPTNLALGKAQLQRAISHYGRDTLLVVLMHHPPSWLTDGGELESFLDQHPHVLLSGHVHHSGGVVSRKTTGGGLVHLTAGAGHKGPRELGYHAYAWGQLDAEGLRLWPRAFVETSKIFKAGPERFKLDGTGAHLARRGALTDPLDAWMDAVLPRPEGLEEERPKDPPAPPEVDGDPLQPLRDKQRDRLGALAGFFLLAGGKGRVAEIFVEVGLGPHSLGRGGLDFDPDQHGDISKSALRHGEDVRLEQVIEDPHRRWVLLGDPGSGKTTLLHDLSLRLMDDAKRTPLFLKLSELEGGWGLRDAVGAIYGAASVEPVLAAAKAGRLVLFLDGLDEALSQKAARSAIRALCRDVGDCPVIVTSRYTGYADNPLRDGFRELALRPLRRDQQEALLTGWGVERGAAREAIDQMARRHRLKVMAENPLLLTLVAILLKAQPERPLPSRRGELYRIAIELLLKRSFSPNLAEGEEPTGARQLRSTDVALDALATVALSLHGAEGEVYPTDHVRRALEGDGELDARVTKEWGSLDAFLKEVSTCSGVLIPEVGPLQVLEAWRFPHRTFREYLAAQALAKDIAKVGLGEVPQEALMGAALRAAEAKVKVAPAPGRLKEVLEDGAKRPSTWSEVLALTCGLMERQSADLLVRRVALTGNPELVLRVVAEAENIREDTVWAVLGLESGGDKWEQRKEVLEQLPALVRDGSAVIRLVDKLLRQTTNGNDLYVARELLRKVAAGEVEGDGTFILTEGDRAQAAALAGDVLKRHRPEAREEAKAILEDQWIPIEGGRFRMGSEDGHDDEKPVHQVTLSPYRLQKVPVTNALYERFDPGHRQERSFADRVKDSEELDRHPVVDVTWYEARMFAEWVGASLPTEARWEYGARGPDGADRRGRKFPWGDREPSERLANFDRKVGHTTPVGTYPDGASWCGALDMAGNVWEWCGDWHGTYDPGQALNPTGPPSGSVRVLRGGSWSFFAGRLRGAFRFGGRPGNRSRLIGFRVALSPADP